MQADFKNAPWLQQVRLAAARDTLSSAMILCGSGDLVQAAAYIAASHLCEAASRPCLVCNSCRKVMQGIHPDVTVVRDPDHKYISVEVIRKLRSDAYIRPNESSRRVFIFPDCTLLTEQDQNVLLKVLEDGPDYAVFLFCAESSRSLLPTIRSRCVEVHITGDEAPEKADEQVQALCLAIAQRKLLAIVPVITAWENKKPKREQLQAALRCGRFLASRALLSRYGDASPLPEAARAMAQALDTRSLQRLTDIFQKAAQDCEYNVGVGLILGAMLCDIEEVIR